MLPCLSLYRGCTFPPDISRTRGSSDTSSRRSSGRWYIANGAIIAAESNYLTLAPVFSHGVGRGLHVGPAAPAPSKRSSRPKSLPPSWGSTAGRMSAMWPLPLRVFKEQKGRYEESDLQRTQARLALLALSCPRGDMQRISMAKCLPSTMHSHASICHDFGGH
ncbi:hypothetical protein BV20DRAFT_974063 [Pilatotrama ljubarskyi]|nr:hypothetical protein BV20DRAFT_974063 [Pilatotrama ljubarskyi]